MSPGGPVAALGGLAGLALDVRMPSGLHGGSIITNHIPIDRFEEACGIVEAGESGKVVIDRV